MTSQLQTPFKTSCKGTSAYGAEILGTELASAQQSAQAN